LVLATLVFAMREEEPAMDGSPPDPEGLSALTPDDVRTATFNQSQLSWRGYSEDEVRAFLDQVADAMVAADQERDGLLSEIDRLRSFYRNHGHNVDVVPNSKARPRPDSDEEDRLLQHVRAYVEVQVAWATKYAGLIDSHDGGKANRAFNHARVQAALAVGEHLRPTPTHGRAATDSDELGRASLWLRSFYHALRAQLRVTNDAVRNAAEQLAARDKALAAREQGREQGREAREQGEDGVAGRS
jgi:DivIVA domain-containing protein